MKLGTRTALEQIARRTVDVEFADLGFAYRLREMSGTERDKYEISAFKEIDGKRTVDALYLRARLIAFCMVNEKGERLYADDEIELLSNAVSASVLGKLFEAAQKLNSLDASAVDGAEKNFVSVPSDASTSA
jgi:hypothetical protein